MRRISTLLLAAVIVTAMAVPVGAAPSKCVDAPWLPGCAPTDEDPPTAVDSVGVHMEVEPGWVHEAADTLRYVVILDNTTATDIEGLLVEFTADSLETKADVIVPANDILALYFTREVREFADASPCLTFEATECELTASVEVSSGDALVGGDSVTTPLYPDPPCGFIYDPSNGFLSNEVPVSDICIWTLPKEDGITKTGIWAITLKPTLPDNTRKPLEAWVDVRDGVPGNWCTLAIGTPSRFSDRWKAPYPPDPTLTGVVYLPGAENALALELEDGMCLGGGAGGDYFAVGNPDAFYLRANGLVTVRWVRELP